MDGQEGMRMSAQRVRGYIPTLEEIMDTMGGADMTVREIAESFRTDATQGIYATLCDGKRLHMVEVVWRDKYLPSWRVKE